MDISIKKFILKVETESQELIMSRVVLNGLLRAYKQESSNSFLNAVYFHPPHAAFTYKGVQIPAPLIEKMIDKGLLVFLKIELLGDFPTVKYILNIK